MKCVILAGGKGSRLSEYTSMIPKPMVKIGNKPILEHIINYYFSYGIKEFIVAGGYKYKVIKNYFKKRKNKYSIKIINTGYETLTGKRIKLLEKYFTKKENFFLTYGDGVSNINLNKLLKFHKSKKKFFTLTAVHPIARFGELKISKGKILKFQEKPQLLEGWINGGFFVVNTDFFKILSNKNVMLEREPMQKLISLNQISAYQHKSFWYCMDNLRDKKVLDNLVKNKKAKWIKGK
tara:strand:- start:14605 stop:15312 length:708 start_codon:yes stop_codon:yes gene_type:complete